MRRSHSVQTPAAALIHLEARVLLAGKVTATLSKSGTLTITGDNANNEISVAPNLSGQIVVSETSGGTVNKSNHILFDAAKIKSVSVSMKMGHDVVHMSGAVLTGTLSVDLGSGNNELDLVDSRVTGNTTIKGGNGGEDITVERTILNGTLTATLGDGINGFGLAQAELHQASTIASGKGNDHISVDNTSSDLPLTIKTGAGDDLVHFDNSVMNDSIRVETSDGLDEFRAENSSFAGLVTVLTGNDNDLFTLLQCDWGAAVTLDGGAATDTYSHDGLNVFAIDPSLFNIESTALV